MSSHRQLQTAAVPEQMVTMKGLGFQPESTEDPKFAEWKGHGLRLTLPSDMKATVNDALNAVIGAAVKIGREQVQGEMKRALGVK